MIRSNSANRTIIVTALWLLSISSCAAEDNKPSPSNSNKLSDYSLVEDPSPVYQDNLIRELCQKYHHCKKPTTAVAAHREDLVEFLGQMIANKTLGVEHSSATQIAALRADFRELFPPGSYLAISYTYGSNPSSRYLDDDRWMLLAFCKKYHHCQSNTVDTLHCYQLESQLLRMKSEKQQKLTSATADNEKKALKADIASFENDLEKLKDFGKPWNYDRSDPFILPARERLRPRPNH